MTLSSTYHEFDQVDPFPYYEQLRAAGPVVWDPSADAWLVTGYQNVAFVLRREDLFTRDPDMVTAENRIYDGVRHVLVLEGEDHRCLHHHLLQLVDQDRVAALRVRIIRPLAHWLIDRFVAHGRAELTGEFADQLPLRTGIAVIGLDPKDEQLVEQLRALRIATDKWKETAGRSADAVAAARRAADELKKFFLPIARERKTRPGDDIVSVLWKSGSAVFDDWSEADAVAGCFTYFGGGQVPYLIANLIHQLLADRTLCARLRTDPDKLVPRFVEETLRCVGVMHWIVRVAAQDTVIEGTPIKKGDRVFAMTAAVGRDPTRYEKPEEINLEDGTRGGHLAFGLGPRACAGVHLARGEAIEAIQTLLCRLKNLRADDGAPGSRLEGFRVRSYRPLYAVFD